MLSEIWGSAGWKFFHLVTVDYPENPTDEEKEHYYHYIVLLQYVLPCGKCRSNMSNHLKKYPLTAEIMSSRKNLVKWGIDLHNVVNYYTGKQMLPYCDALNEIDKWIHPKKSSNLVYYALLVIAFLIICYLVYHFKKN